MVLIPKVRGPNVLAIDCHNYLNQLSSRKPFCDHRYQLPAGMGLLLLLF